jgi:hypothetical protein
MVTAVRNPHSDLVPSRKMSSMVNLASGIPELYMPRQLNEAVGVLSKAWWRVVEDEVTRQAFPHPALICGLEGLQSSPYNLLVVGSVCGHEVPLIGRV